MSALDMYSGSPQEAQESGLLAPDEPRPFDLVNPGGKTPVLLLCDHATRFVPRALKSLGLDEAQLARHIAWDIGIAEVTRHMARRLDAPAVLSHFSRLIVDPNRLLDNPTLIPEISDGTVVPGNRDLGEAARRARIDAFFRPYHEAVAAQIDAMMAGGQAEGPAGGRTPVLVSMHSFTPVMHGLRRPWEIGILWNRDPRLPRPLMERLRAEGLTVGDNEPYSGADGHGYTQHVHGDRRGLANVLIEVRQDLIDTQQGAAEWAERLSAVLEAVLGDPALYRVEHY
ncbi:N-formylglutamate amidohydrolase [Pelagibius sp. CAU 1746]|uniref:N-formylglutamate amidohydrolase n=1 Tax=Pelagibius sp. CAU 1746 TaxID=3140370 RepID=UPI00325BB42C